MTEEQDQFEFWLMDMDDAIENFRRSIPAELASRLDFSDQSLKALEDFVLQTYPGVEAVTKPGEATTVDGMARYVGEVFRKHLGGRWFVDHSDRKNAFYGLPQLKNLKGQIVQICPMTLVTTSTDRRRGDFIFSVFSNMRNRANPT